MFRFWFFLSLFCFVILVGWGIGQTVEQFNRTVLPAQPIKPLNISDTDPNRIQIEVMGERVDLDKAAIENKIITIKEIAGETREQWKLWMESDRVKAVNLWVREKI